MGMRACFPVAFSLVYVYRLFRPTVHLLEGMGGVREMQLRAIDKGDALIAISFAPYSQETVHAVELARARGCKVLALTDSLASPLSSLRTTCSSARRASSKLISPIAACPSSIGDEPWPRPAAGSFR